MPCEGMIRIGRLSCVFGESRLGSTSTCSIFRICIEWMGWVAVEVVSRDRMGEKDGTYRYASSPLQAILVGLEDEDDPPPRTRPRHLLDALDRPGAPTVHHLERLERPERNVQVVQILNHLLVERERLAVVVGLDDEGAEEGRDVVEEGGGNLGSGYLEVLEVEKERPEAIEEGDGTRRQNRFADRRVEDVADRPERGGAAPEGQLEGFVQHNRALKVQVERSQGLSTRREKLEELSVADVDAQAEGAEGEGKVVGGDGPAIDDPCVDLQVS